ncbi:MAG: InlB B-repeat-containing protein, partial [Clostridia bacterium]|nr:InlB B-repeat-containing protein [Clostridia bacterium]
MKIKSKLFLVFALCLVAILAVSLVACNPDGDDSGDGPNKYENSTYTVTFNTDSKDMTSISTPVLRNVPSGSHISEPTDADGNKIIPYKRGYTFQFWAKSNGDQFNFASDVITANTTLKASYKANEYVHTAMLSEKYVYDRTENADTDEEKDIYVKVARTDTVTLSDAEFDPAVTTLKSTYGASSAKLPVPTSSEENNKFCFWYYINKDGKPIQFSKWAISGSSTVDELTSYSFVSEDINNKSKGLELYPMFERDLPSVTVRYEDGSYGGDAILPSLATYRFGQNIDYATTIGPKPTKTGYEFIEWYYETEKTSNGVTTVEKNTFTFDDGGENTKPTSPMDAAGAENNFKPVELVLKASWIKQITIESLNDYKALYQEIRDLIAELKTPTDT